MENLHKKLTQEIAEQMIEKMSSKDFTEAVEKTKAANEDSGTFDVIISTSGRDRQGEIVDQTGWDLENYKKNPVVLLNHDYWSLPIGRCDSIGVEDGKLRAKGRFAPMEANPIAQQVRRLYEAGMMPATSVGFIPKEMEGNVITKAELLEFSFVPVPANPEVEDMAKSLGIDVELMYTKGIFKKSDEAPEEKTPEEVKEDEVTLEIKDEEKKDEDPIVPEVIPEKTPEQIEAEEIEKSMKSGRVLSAKNADLIKSAIEGCKATITALEELLVASEGDGSGKSQDNPDENKDGSITDAGQNELVKALEITGDSRKVLKLIATVTGKALENFNSKHNK